MNDTQLPSDKAKTSQKSTTSRRSLLKRMGGTIALAPISTAVTILASNTKAQAY